MTSAAHKIAFSGSNVRAYATIGPEHTIELSQSLCRLQDFFLISSKVGFMILFFPIVYSTLMTHFSSGLLVFFFSYPQCAQQIADSF